MISKSRLRLDRYSSSGPYGSQSTCHQILDSASAKEEGGVEWWEQGKVGKVFAPSATPKYASNGQGECQAAS